MPNELPSVAKSQVTHLFDQWLTLMEKANESLSKEEFRELEERIKYEIRWHRHRRAKNVHAKRN